MDICATYLHSYLATYQSKILYDKCDFDQKNCLKKIITISLQQKNMLTKFFFIFCDTWIIVTKKLMMKTNFWQKICINQKIFVVKTILKQGPTRHRPMAHPVVFRYLSYSTTLAEHAVHRLRRCPAFGQAGTCFFLSVQWNNQSVSKSPSNTVAT